MRLSPARIARSAAPLVFLLLLLLVVFSGCPLPLPSKLPGPAQPPSLGKFMELPGKLLNLLPKEKPADFCANFVSRDDCYLQFAQDNQAPDYCKKIAGSPKAEQCLLGIALLTKNQAICKIYSAAPSKCLYDFALSLARPDSCVEIGDSVLSDACYAALGAKLSDPNVCQLAHAKDSKSNCLYAVAQKTKSVKSCADIFDNDLRYKCLFDLSERLSDPGLCSKLEAAFPLDDCWKGMALVKKDASLCAKVNDGAMRDACNVEVGRVTGAQVDLKNQLLAVCDKLAEDARPGCKARLESYVVDEDFCDGFEPQAVKFECLDTLNRFFLDAQLCPKYRSREASDACFEAVALARGSIASCKLVVDVAKEMSCIYKLAVKEKNAKYCGETRVTDTFDYRNQCYHDVAVLNRQPATCDLMYVQERRASCRAELAVLDQNYSVCKEIGNEAISDSPDPFFSRDTCFLGVVKVTHDTSLCDFVQDAGRKAACKALSAAPGSG